MKKVLAVLLIVCISVCAFAACSKTGDGDKGTEQSYKYSTKHITTDTAKIKEADAINLIQTQYTAKELGLSKEDYNDCSFMVSGSGFEIDGKFYIKVIAAVKHKHTDDDGNESFTFDSKGEYFISYDGKTILQKDMSAEEDAYNKMEVREVPVVTAHSTEENTENKK